MDDQATVAGRHGIRLAFRRYWLQANHKARDFDTVTGLYRHVRGLIDYAELVDEPFSDKLRAKFEAIAWSLDIPASD